jgi:hypothetical protein
VSFFVICRHLPSDNCNPTLPVSVRSTQMI